jgi:alpha-glucosidase
MKTIKLLTCLFFVLGLSKNYSQQKKFELFSPNGEIKVSISLEDKIYYTLSVGNEVLASKNHLALMLQYETLGANPKLSGSKTGKINEVIKPAVPLKYSSVSNTYN